MITIMYVLFLVVALTALIAFNFHYESLPQIFDRKGYKAWKRVMSYTHPQYDKLYSYMEYDIEWHINICFEEDPNCVCSIFRTHGETFVLIYEKDVVVFSSFWKKHSQKIIDRFIPEIESMEIEHL